MKRSITSGILILLATACSAPALAGQMLQVTVHGELTGEGNESGPYNAGVDPNLSVGTVFTMTARFDSSRLAQFSDYGFSEAGMSGLGTSGAEYWRVDAGGMTWQASDNELDYHPVYTYDDEVNNVTFNVALPAIIIQGGKVIGLAADNLYPADNSDRPSLYLGSIAAGGYDTFTPGDNPGDPAVHDSYHTPATLSNMFQISAPDGNYGNIYPTQGFPGVWDFAGSSVTAVPEPATWALLLLGFGGIGASLRHRRRVASAAGVVAN